MALPPALLLALLCTATLVLFSDRGVFSCNSVNGKRGGLDGPGYGIQGELDLSLLQDGVLAAGMMSGLMVSAPTSAQLSRHFPAMRMLAAGLSLWVLGAAGCALAPSFAGLLASRLAVGAGCGPFIALAAPLIDDQAPRRHKSTWLALLFLCIPVGFALGYIAGGVVGTAFGWRAAFALEAAAMLPLAAATLLAPPVELRSGRTKPAGAAAAAEPGEPPLPASSSSRSPLLVLAADCRQLAQSPVCMLTILALSSYNGALGCYAFYGPKAARDVFALPPKRADLLFGGITVATGVLGTLCGGAALDRMGPSVHSALLLCTGGTLAGSCLIFAGFAAARTMAGFAPAFAAGEFGMFLMAVPVNAVLMWSVPPDLRPFALSAAEFAQHALGDIPSPPLLGWLQGRLGDWRLSMCACTALLAVAAALFLVALCASTGAVSYREVAQVEGGELEEGGEGAGRGSGERQHGRSTGGSDASGAGDADLEEPLLQGVG